MALAWAGLLHRWFFLRQALHVVFGPVELAVAMHHACTAYTATNRLLMRQIINVVMAVAMAAAATAQTAVGPIHMAAKAIGILERQ